MAESNYIHANARFCFRSDSLENWQETNPILLKGEFCVVTNGSESEKVKIGDGITSWNELPWWNGPKGEKGDRGENGTMPTIDQVPDHTSENAVSNKAMIQYVNDNISNTEQYVDNKVSNIEVALDSIIAMQNNLLGGDAE